MTTPTRDRVREAREAVKALARFATENIHVYGEEEFALKVDAALDAYCDALLDAVDEDVAGLPPVLIGGKHYNQAITDTRAAIRARKETT